MQPDFSKIGSFLLAVLVVFAIYRRLRRTFGRQALRPARMSIRIFLFLLIAGALAPVAARSAAFLSAVLAGAAAGVALAVWGVSRTRFVMYGAQLNYLPHTYTGIAVSLLFLGRLIYRVFEVYGQAHAANPTQGIAPLGMVQSPLTVGLFFVLIGYYVYYYGAVLWKSKHLVASDIEKLPESVLP